MRPYLIFFIIYILTCVAFSSKIYAQKKPYIPNYSKTRQAPFWKNKNPKKLAEFLTKGIENDSLKVVAISCWIAKKIRYDVHGFIYGRSKAFSSKKVLRRRRRALCEEFSVLFKEMCESQGIEAVVVPGYIRHEEHFPGDTLYRANHAWSVVKVNNEWKLFDLSWACGAMIQRKMLIRRFLYFTIKIPYRQKYRFKRGVNTNYCFAVPEKLIHDHYPVLPTFQLLANPISMESFVQGTDSFKQALNSSKTTYPFTIDDFNNVHPIEQWNLYSKYGYQDHSTNNRNKGYYNSLIIDSLYKKHYDNQLRVLLIGSQQLNRLKSLTDSASNSLEKALEDNELEYKFYVNRSGIWKNDLKSLNKDLKTKIRADKSLLNKQKSAFKRTNRKAKGLKKSSVRKSKTVKQSHISRIRRPKQNKEKNSEKAEEYISFSDSIFESLPSSIAIKDSILSLFDDDFFKVITETEKTVAQIRKEAKKSHKSLLTAKRFWRPIYYGYPAINPIYKPEIVQLIDSSSTLNQTITDSLIFLYHDLQKDASLLMKKYYRESKISFSLLKKAKRKSFEDLNEELVFSKRREQFREDLLKYAEQLKKRKEVLQLLISYKSSVKSLKKLSSTLTKEIAFEANRHTRYKSSRRVKKNREHATVNSIKEISERVFKAIDRTEKYQFEQQKKHQGL